MSYRWPEHRLGDVCAITSDFVDPRDAAYCDLPHVGGGNMASGSDVLIDVKSASEEKLISGKFAFSRGVVLYSKIRPYLKKVSRPSFDGLCSADVYPLTPRVDRIVRDYLYYLLLSDDFTAYAEQGSARSGMPKVNRDHLFDFRFRLPPLAEQQRIVAILDKAFESLEEARAKTTASAAEVRQLLNVAVDRLLTHDTADWRVCDLPEVTFFQEGPGIRSYEYAEKGYPIINVRCVRDGTIDLSSAKAVDPALANGKWKHFQVDEGDILFTTSGTIGRVSRVGPDNLPLLMNTSVVRFRATSPELSNEFLIRILKSNAFQSELLALATGSAQLNVGPTHLKTMAIHFPGLEKQRALVQHIDKIEDECARLIAKCDLKLSLLAELKESLFARAFSGEMTREPLAA